MASPLEQAGAVREPSEYAALSMDRAITGLWTQRSPLRDADVPYLYGKFYSASRFDSLIDGINREVTAKLTWRRRPGCSVYNSNSFPAANSFYSYKRIVNGVEVVRVIEDGVDGVIYDATAGQKSTIFTKSAGAGKARFQGVNTALYFSDGVENKKWLQPGPWVAQTAQATTQYQVGTTVIDSNGNIEYLSSVKVGSITNVALAVNVAAITFSGTNFNLLPGMSFIPTGLSGASFLNGKFLFAASVAASGGNFVVTAQFAGVPYASAADTGTASTTDVSTLATTGGSAPTWAGSVGSATTDGLSIWTNFGTPLFDWGPPPAPLQAPALAPVVTSPGIDMAFWQPFTRFAGLVTILDPIGNIQRTAGGGTTGGKFPTFAAPGGGTLDGGEFWYASGWLGAASGPAPWKATTTPTRNSAAGGDCCIDSNGNLQIASAGSGATGGSAPVWNTTYGAGTTDSGITWANLGPYLALVFQGRKWGYAYHCIDGSVSTMSPLTQSSHALIDGALLSGNYSTSAQVDAVWIFATADGQAIPLFLASIPNNTAGGTWSYTDQAVDFQLNAFIVGPQNQANNPPPVGATAPLFHLNRMWLIYQNTVICSGGPNTLVGNGNTAFAPLNLFPIPEQPIRLFPTITSAGPGVLIWARANIYIILGDGSLANPFKPAARYMAGCGILSYDAVVHVGSTFHAFGNTALVNGQLVGKAFSLDPGAGYVEFGFPIGDQFQSVTTGAGGKAPNSSVPLGNLYNPANAFVTWAELGSGDTAVYVADGAVGWFRHAPVASPETGNLWSPRAVIAGGTSAVQGLETQPGVMQLLIGPPAGGGQGSVQNSVLTWVSGPKFNAGMVGQTVTLVSNTGSSTALVTGFVSSTQLTLGVVFPPTPVAVQFSIPGVVGPILFRDSATNQDNGVPYPGYDVKGCIQLCLSGEVGELAHVHVVSQPQGKRPVVGLLFGEVLASTAAPFSWYDPTSSEPPNLPASLSVYSDRYSMLSKGVTPKCLFFQLGMDYGTQNFPDETLMFSVFGAKYAERKQQ